MIDPGPDEAAWVASIDWEWSAARKRCGRCNRSFTGRGPTLWCKPCQMVCGHPSKVRGVTIIRDGNQRPVFACLMCGGLVDAPRSDPARWTGTHVFRDLRTEGQRTTQPCARCGADEGTQEHHWAPRAIFGPDAESWPTSWLCKGCHSQWHRLMRQGQGYRREEAWTR